MSKPGANIMVGGSVEAWLLNEIADAINADSLEAETVVINRMVTYIESLHKELAAAQAKLDAMPTPAMIRAAAKSLRSSLWSRNAWETMAENALAAAFAEAREAR